MLKHGIGCLTTCVFLLAGLDTSGRAEEERRASMASLEGIKAPGFSLPGSDGKTHALPDYTGKTVILYFYPKDDTPGCTKEACGFRDANQEIRKRGAVVLGVSKDSPDSHAAFIKNHQLPFVLLSDEDKSVMRAYGAWGRKLLYGKFSEGTIRSTVIIGPDGTVLKHWTGIRDAGAHPDEVLRFLEEYAASHP